MGWLFFRNLSRCVIVTSYIMVFLGRLIFVSTLMCLLCAIKVSAQSLFVPNDKPRLNVSRANGKIDIDGELGDPGWVNAAKAENFAEHTPGDRVKPPVNTEVLVTYDDDNLYMAFICHDDAATVRSSMRDRDEIFNDDYVGILLDTYGDGAWAYEIFVNPLGLQGDLKMVTNGEEDMGFDIVFHSRGHITADGWQVEVAVPFSSLRFPVKPVQEWRATFWRNRPRSVRERSTWAAINRDESCFSCQWGTLVGFENVKPGSRLELLPSLIGFQSSVRETDGENAGPMRNSDPDGEASLNMRYLLSSDLTADLTYNPDFSQIESDAAQIDVNNVFALFYPERRPFFQEGGDLFSSFTNIVYTRSINDPQFAAKLTGRLSRRTAIGYIGARDEHTPLLLPFDEFTDLTTLGKSVTNIARVKQTLGDESYIGATVTDRRIDDGGSGSVFGSDFSLRLNKNHRINGQFLASHTEEPNLPGLYDNPFTFDDGKHTATLDGENYWGKSIYAEFEREARLWNVELSFNQLSPNFRADNGFIFRNAHREGSLWTGLFFRPKSKTFIEVSPTLSLGRIWGYDGARRDEWVVPAISLLLPAQTSISSEVLFSRETFRTYYFPGIKHYQLDFESRFSEPVSIDGGFKKVKYIARNLDAPVLGEGWIFEGASSIKLFKRLIIRPQWEYSELKYPDRDEFIFAGYVLRTQLNYQFTREWFLRMIVQYDDFDRSMSIEPLISYKLNPFTIFYLGSTHAYERYGLDSKMSQSSRQFFFKLQYLLRT